MTTDVVSAASRISIRLEGRILEIRFPSVFSVVSWAPWNGGIGRAAAVVNVQVSSNGCGMPATHRKLFLDVFERLELSESTVGMMTAADVANFTECRLERDGVWVHAVATVGLTNARSVLDDADVPLGDRRDKPGTINLVVATNALPNDAGRLQALQIASAAKATALFDKGILSAKSGRPASLTGTDCIVIASSGDLPEDHCGLHTVLGELIGRSVHHAITAGCR